MSEAPLLRYDITISDWVPFSPARANCPHVPPRSTREDVAPEGPFCPGHESRTPEEVLRVSATSRCDGWAVRVVRNNFPALDRSAVPEQVELGPAFRQMGGYGVHEVVIESPEHSQLLARQAVPTSSFFFGSSRNGSWRS